MPILSAGELEAQGINLSEIIIMVLGVSMRHDSPCVL